MLLFPASGWGQCASDSVTDISSMNQQQFSDWQDLFQTWEQTYLTSCLGQENIVLSCAGCESVYLRVVFCTDSAGKVIHYDIIRENLCGRMFSEGMKACFLEFFINLVWPVSLRQKNLEVLLGRGLKC